MIVLRTCACGRAHGPASWSRLEIITRFVEAGDEWRARRCDCGRPLTVKLIEDDAAVEIDRARSYTAIAYASAALELAMHRYAKAARLAERWDHFVEVRAEARAHRRLAQQCEAMLASIYRARELREPRRRIGRNLVVVGTDVDAMADTERPPALGAR